MLILAKNAPRHPPKGEVLNEWSQANNQSGSNSQTIGSGLMEVR